MKSIVRTGMVVLGVLAVVGLLVPSSTPAAEEIKIGVIYPLTGGAAARPSRQGTGHWGFPP